MNDVSVLVVSCDAYADVWQYFFTFFERMWPDCPYPVYLGSNFQKINLDWVTVVNVGPDIGWGSNLQRMLAQLKSKYVLLLIENFFLIHPPMTSEIKHMAGAAIMNNIGCLRLNPIPPPTKRSEYSALFGEIQKGDEYRVATQEAIWDVQLLKKIASPEFSAWDFEIMGTRLSYRFNDTFCSVYEPLMEHVDAIQRGQWSPAGVAMCRSAGLSVNFDERGVWSSRRLLMKKLRQEIKPIVIAAKFLPASVQRFIRLRRKNRMIEKLLVSAQKRAEE